MDLVHEFLRWGPYGLYATFVLMICAIPLGWMYAYVACVGRHRDITEPDPERVRTAWGAAVLIALVVVVSRHLLAADIDAYRVTALNWMRSGGYITFAGSMTRPILAYASSFATPDNNMVVRLFAAAILVFLAPASLAVVLFLMLVLIVAIFIGVGLAFFSSYSLLASTLGAALWYLPGFVIGVPIVLYFLFVRLPLQVAYRRAIREGRWPTTNELVRALAMGILDKNDWQSKIMAYKSRRFETSLNNEAARIARRK